MARRFFFTLLALLAATSVARAESAETYQLEGDEDGARITATLRVEGTRVEETVGERRWIGVATREGPVVRLRFEVPLDPRTPGLIGALDRHQPTEANARNVFTGTLSEDAKGVVSHELVNETRFVPDAWARIQARGVRSDGRLKLGGALKAERESVPVFVPTQGTLTVTSSAGPIVLRAPGGSVVGSGATITCEAQELGAYAVEVGSEAQGGTLAASFVQSGAAKERPWSSHTWYPLYEFESDGSLNEETLYAPQGPLEKLDRAFGLVGAASSVYWEKGGDYRTSPGLDHGHYIRVARPRESNAESDWKCDLDGDGSIGAAPAETFARMDRDKDGVVTRDEAYDFFYEAALERAFREYDRDGDGKLTEKEIAKELVLRWGTDGAIDRAAFRAGIAKDYPTLLAAEAARERDALLAGRDTLRLEDMKAGFDFLDADDVDEDGKTLFDMDNIRVTLADGTYRFGNRTALSGGLLTLWKGPNRDRIALDSVPVNGVREIRRGIADGRLDGSYDASWWGHCNAWATAAILFARPAKPVTLNGVEFSVRDQKGLLVELAMGDTEDSSFTWDEFGPEIPPARYTAAFHRQLAHWLRDEKKGLFADMQLKDRELGPWPVWNYPLVGYEAVLVEAPGDDPSVLDAKVRIDEASYSDDDGTHAATLTYRLHFAGGEIRDDASAKTDWTTKISIGGSERRGYVRYLIHPFRLTGRGRNGNPVVTEDRVKAIVPEVSR